MIARGSATLPSESDCTPQAFSFLAHVKPPQVFDYQRAAAEADWISAVTPAFVLHAVRVTYPEAWARPLYLAQLPPPVEDDPSSWALWADTELTREASDAHWEAYYATTATLAELNRDLEHANHAAQLDVNEATADKLYAVANATTDKAYAIAVAGGAGSLPINALDAGGNLADQHNAGLAANDYGHTLDIEDSKLGFQQLETISRQGYSNLLATAQNTRDIKLATAARDAAITEAGYQASADLTFALAEEADWRGETTIDNAVAWAKAMADANLWTAEEAANVSGAQALDTALTTTLNGQPHHLPWTQFLVAEAQAHKQWWGNQNDPASAAAKYVQWVKDRNNAQKTWQDNVNAAYDTDQYQVRTAEYNAAVNTAGAEWNLAVAQANADFTYLADPTQGLIVLSKLYDDDVALIGHNTQIKLAQASADLAVNRLSGDTDTAFNEYESQVAGIEADRNSGINSDNATYRNVASNTAAALLLARANANYADDAAIAGVVMSRKTAIADAAFTYEVSSAVDYANLIAQDAALDRSFSLARSSSLKTRAENLAAATSTASPWTTYFAVQMGAFDTWSQSVDVALETERIASADADAGVDVSGNPTGGGEIGIDGDERDAFDAAALADQGTAIGLASEELQTASAAVSAVGADAGSIPLPKLENPAAAAASFITPSQKFDTGAAGMGVGLAASFTSIASEAKGIEDAEDAAPQKLEDSGEETEVASPAPADSQTSNPADEAAEDAAVAAVSARRESLLDELDDDTASMPARAEENAPVADDVNGAEDQPVAGNPSPPCKSKADDAVRQQADAANDADDAVDTRRQELVVLPKDVLEDFREWSRQLDRQPFERVWKAYTTDREFKRIIDDSLEYRRMTVAEALKIVLVPEEARRLRLLPEPELAASDPSNATKERLVVGISGYSPQQLKESGVPRGEIDWWTKHGYTFSVSQTLGTMRLDPERTLFEPHAFSVAGSDTDKVFGAILTDLNTGRQWFGLPQISYTYKNGYDPGNDWDAPNLAGVASLYGLGSLASLFGQKPSLGLRSGPDPANIEANIAGPMQTGWLFFNYYSDVAHNLSGKLRMEYVKLSMQLYGALAAGIGAVRGVNRLAEESGGVTFTRPPHPRGQQVPGTWKEVARNASGDSLDFQSALSGKPIHYRDGKAYIEEFLLDGKYFDDFRDGVLADVKGDYSFAARVAQYNPDVKAVKELFIEARTQLDIARNNGLRLEWYVRTQDLQFFKDTLGPDLIREIVLKTY